MRASSLSYGATTATAVVVAALACLAVQLDLHGFVTDPFHQGEYFSYFMSVRSGTFSGHALSLHGALDYLPAWVAHAIGSADHSVFWTLIANAAASVAAAAVFGLTANALLRDSPFRFHLLLAAVIVAPLLLSARDLFALLSLWLLVLRLSEIDRTAAVRTSLEIALGISLGVGVFWSFDRGLAQTVAIVGTMLYAFVSSRRLGVALASWVATVVMLSLTCDVFSLSAYVDNIRFIADVSSQFSYGFQRSSLALTTGGLVFTLGAMVLLWQTARSAVSQQAPLLALAMALLCGCVFKTVSYRPDIEHFAMMIWVPALATLFALDHLRRLPSTQPLVGCVALAMCGTSALLAVEFWSADNPLFIACALFAYLVFLCSQRDTGADRGWRRVPLHLVVGIAIVAMMQIVQFAYSRDRYRWMAQVALPPANEAAVSKDVVWVTRLLRSYRVACVMDLSNHGVINGVLDLPACTRFSYPVYATAKYEEEMIAALSQSQVPAIVYSSRHWSYRIDDVPMSVRLPKLDTYLLATFPVEQCKGMYCIRSRM